MNELSRDREDVSCDREEEEEVEVEPHPATPDLDQQDREYQFKEQYQPRRGRTSSMRTQ